MSQVNKEAQKERHKKILEASESPPVSRFLEKLARTFRAVMPFHYLKKKLSPYRHPSEKLHGPERLYRRVIACGVLLLVFTSLNFKGITYASNPDYEAYLAVDRLAISEEELVAMSDLEGFLLKSAPYGSSICDTSRDHKLDYEVQYGDTLSGIATCYDIEVASIFYANPTLGSGDYLKVGQSLTIPEGNGIYVQIEDEGYTGKDLKGLIETHAGNYESTLSQNRLSEASVLAQGTEIFIVDGEPPAPIVTTSVASTEPTPVSSVREMETETETVAVETTIPEEVIVEAPPPVIEVSYPQGDPAPVVEEPPAPQIEEAPVETYEPAPDTGGYIWPVAYGAGYLSCGYLCYTGHYAIDIADDSMPDTVASKSGTVTTASYGWNGGYGNYIVIDHGDGSQTLYAHHNTLYVSVGDYVYQGQPIGQMGNTGNVWGGTGIHVHFEIIINGVKQNPSNYVW